MGKDIYTHGTDAIVILLVLTSTHRLAHQALKRYWFRSSSAAEGQTNPSSAAKGDPSRAAEGLADPSRAAKGQADPSSAAKGPADPISAAEGQAYPSSAAKGDPNSAAEGLADPTVVVLPKVRLTLAVHQRSGRP